MRRANPFLLRAAPRLRVFASLGLALAFATPQGARTTPADSPLELPVVVQGLDGLQWGGAPLVASQARGLETRFERFLLSPAEEQAQAEMYARTIQELMDLLSPARLSDGETIRADVLATAQRRLFAAAGHPLDAGASATLAAQIKQAWLFRAEIRADYERMAAEPGRVARNPERKSEAPDHEARRESKRAEEAKLLAAIQAGEVLKSASPDLEDLRLGSRDVRTKGERARLQFQGFIVTQMMQRRFEHALMACYFYRVMFKASAQRLDAGIDYLAKALPLGGNAPSVDSLEQLCRESIAKAGVDAATAAQAAEENRCLAALATLGEAFVLGEHLPAVQLWAGARRGELYRVRQTSVELAKAWDERNLDRVLTLAGELEKRTGDFSPTVVLARVETLRQASRAAHALSRMAAKEGRIDEAAQSLARARELWPLNPDLPKSAPASPSSK